MLLLFQIPILKILDPPRAMDRWRLASRQAMQQRANAGLVLSCWWGRSFGENVEMACVLPPGATRRGRPNEDTRWVRQLALFTAVAVMMSSMAYVASSLVSTELRHAHWLAVAGVEPPECGTGGDASSDAVGRVLSFDLESSTCATHRWRWSRSKLLSLSPMLAGRVGGDTLASASLQVTDVYIHAKQPLLHLHVQCKPFFF
jgi:hypothetical protein